MIKKLFLISLVLIFLLQVKLFAQKVEVFTGLSNISKTERYRVSASKDVKDYKFELCHGDNDKNYVLKETSYKGKNEKGENTWLYEDSRLSTTLTLLKDGGLKTFVKLKEAQEGFYNYYGQLSIYKAKKEFIYLVDTKEKITMSFENPAEEVDIDELKVLEDNFTSQFHSKKDFTITANKTLDLLMEKTIKLSFKNKNQEIHWELDGEKKVFKKK